MQGPAGREVQRVAFLMLWGLIWGFVSFLVVEAKGLMGTEYRPCDSYVKVGSSCSLGALVLALPSMIPFISSLGFPTLPWMSSMRGSCWSGGKADGFVDVMPEPEERRRAAERGSERHSGVRAPHWATNGVVPWAALWCVQCSKHLLCKWAASQRLTSTFVCTSP